MGEQVPLQKTPQTPEGLRDGLLLGHLAQRGVAPSKVLLRIAWSMCAVETARGSIIWNHNVGNIKYFPSNWSGDWVDLNVPEGHDEPPLQRAYASLQEGASDWWELMYRKYSACIVEGERGNIDGWAEAAHTIGYFVSEPGPYARAMREHSDFYLRIFPDASKQSRATLLLATVGMVAAATLWEART